jgi:hypothetical protein
MQIDREHRAGDTLSAATSEMLLDRGSPAVVQRDLPRSNDAHEQLQDKLRHAPASLRVSHEQARPMLGQLSDDILAPDSQCDDQRRFTNSSNRAGTSNTHMHQPRSIASPNQPTQYTDGACRTSDAEEARLAAEGIDIFEIARQLEARLSEQEILDLAKEIVLDPGFLETCRRVKGCYQLRMLAGV